VVDTDTTSESEPTDGNEPVQDAPDASEEDSHDGPNHYPTEDEPN